MSRYLLLLVVAAAVLADGYVFGRWSGRWHETNELTDAMARIDQVPLTVGDWEGTPLELQSGVAERAEISGYALRRYENRRTGAVVNVLFACGRPGPLSVHTPEVCYRGAGFHMLAGDAKRQTSVPGPGGVSAEVWMGTFARDAATPERLRVVWAWGSSGGSWTAPDNPRWQFAGQSVLYKLYITQEFFPRDDATDGKDCLEFLRAFLPELDRWRVQDH